MITSERIVGEHTVGGRRVNVVETTWRGKPGRSYDLVDAETGETLTVDESFDAYPSDAQIADAWEASLAVFAVRTGDTDWIARNSGVVDDDGRVTVQVPTSEVTEFTFAGRQWLRRYFGDRPNDARSSWLVCPAAWVTSPPSPTTPTTAPRKESEK
jgi:hypothetical protein